MAKFDVYADLIDGKDAAKILRHSAEYLRVRVSRGEIPNTAMYAIGSLRVYLRSEIEAFAAKEKAERTAKSKARAAEARQKAARARKRAARKPVK